MGSQNDLSGLDILRTKWKFENRLNDVNCNIQTVSPDDAENQAVWAVGGVPQILMPPHLVFLGATKHLYMWVCLSVRPSIGP